MPALLIITVGYLLGSLPTAYIFGRILTKRDIRRLGDENAGAANVYREMGAGAGIIVGVIDALKGAIVILIARAADAPQVIVLIAGVAAVAGHNWPVFLGFRGGRGVSTTIGVLFMLVTLPMLILTLPTVLILVLTRNVTPPMAFFFIALPFVDWWLNEPAVFIWYGLALAVLIGITTFFRTRLKVRPA
jgi:acyl phosphate:glycerol-3-phosphate acyltransferase